MTIKKCVICGDDHFLASLTVAEFEEGAVLVCKPCLLKHSELSFTLNGKLSLEKWIEQHPHPRTTEEVVRGALEAFVHGEIVYEHKPRVMGQPPMRFSVHPSHDMEGKIGAFVVREHKS